MTENPVSLALAQRNRELQREVNRLRAEVTRLERVIMTSDAAEVVQYAAWLNHESNYAPPAATIAHAATRLTGDTTPAPGQALRLL